MSTYVIGDVQGCYHYLQELLHKIHFNEKEDVLWFTGDLVNRGLHSLETLRFVKNLGHRHHTVLGNHDLHLLAVAHNKKELNKDDTFNAILAAPDRDELLHWLRHQPLLHHDDTLNFTMVHAGLAASWDLETAKQLAHEVEIVLRSADAENFYENMYGNFPNQWDSHLTGHERLRCITNYFTRARFCHPDGSLELSKKGKLSDQSETLIPWFQLPHRKNANLKIIFGHWAALGGITQTPNVYALDTGCVWGNALSAMRLEDLQMFYVKCY